MAADLYIHILEGVTEDNIKRFEGNTIGSKYFGTPCTDEEWDVIDRKLAKTPAVWVGEVSWLKAALLDDNDTYIPAPVMAVSEAIGEDFPVIDDELIGKVQDALAEPNQTGYKVNDPKEVLAFLTKHKGKKCFTIAW